MNVDQSEAKTAPEPRPPSEVVAEPQPKAQTLIPASSRGGMRFRSKIPEDISHPHPEQPPPPQQSTPAEPVIPANTGKRRRSSRKSVDEAPLKPIEQPLQTVESQGGPQVPPASIVLPSHFDFPPPKAVEIPGQSSGIASNDLPAPLAPERPVVEIQPSRMDILETPDNSGEPAGGSTPPWNPMTGYEAEDSLSKQDAWAIPPSTPRFLRHGDTVSDWDSPAHPSHSQSTSSNFYEGLGTTYGGYLGFSSLITPVKVNIDGVPDTPGRGIVLPSTLGTATENSGRVHVQATPDMSLLKNRSSAEDLNTPNPKVNPTWSSFPHPPPRPPPAAPAVEKYVHREYSSSPPDDNSLKLILKSVNPSGVTVPNSK